MNQEDSEQNEVDGMKKGAVTVQLGIKLVMSSPLSFKGFHRHTLSTKNSSMVNQSSEVGLRWQNTLCRQGVQSFVIVLVCDKEVPSLITLPLYELHQRSDLSNDLMLLKLVLVVNQVSKVSKVVSLFKTDKTAHIINNSLQQLQKNAVHIPTLQYISTHTHRPIP